MKNYVYGDHFCGNKISEYGLQNGYVDYYTFSRAFDAVLNNNIISNLTECGYYFEPINDPDFSEEIEELGTMRDEYMEKSEEMDNRAAEYADMDNATYYDEEMFFLAIADHFKIKADEIQDQIWELEDYSSYTEIFQYFIVSDPGAELIQEYTNDPLFYCEDLDIYVWGVTHFGTSWSYVLTDIKCNTGKF